MQNVVWQIFPEVFYIALPAVMIWGWLRWSKREKARTHLSVLSLVGFAFATLSALLALFSILYAHAIGGFPLSDPRLQSTYRWGLSLSLSGVVFGMLGVWRPGPLRWHAPACAVGTLLYWILMVSTE